MEVSKVYSSKMMVHSSRQANLGLELLILTLVCLKSWMIQTTSSFCPVRLNPARHDILHRQRPGIRLWASEPNPIDSSRSKRLLKGLFSRKKEKKDKKAIESTKAKPDVENNSPENAEEEKCEAERGETDRRELAGTEGLEKVFKRENQMNNTVNKTADEDDEKIAEEAELDGEEPSVEEEEKEQQSSSDIVDQVSEKEDSNGGSTADKEAVEEEEKRTELPDPLDLSAQLAFFNKDEESPNINIEDEGGRELEARDDNIEAQESDENTSESRFPWNVLLRRKQYKMEASLEEEIQPTIENQDSQPPYYFSGDESPKKASPSRLRRAVRLVVMVSALILASPFVADELEDRFLVQQSSKIQSHDDLEPVDPIVPDSEASQATEEATKAPSNKVEKSSVSPTKGKAMTLQQKKEVALSFVTDVVHEVGPAVVRVDTEMDVIDQRDSPQPPGYVQQGQGSGLIFSSQGFILTNAHVVEDANKVSVTLTDGRVFTCQVMGSDEIVDIAVLKIVNREGSPVSDLPVAELGDSDTLSVGKIVIAVGSPGGLDNTVTMGIVSGLERSSTMVGIPHKKVDYIQTDAAINPGNSGGPLIDVQSGKVVGINAAIRAHMEGTSFAIPINRVRDIMSDLSEGREIQHGYLGLGLASCTPEWARQNNAEGSPAIPEVYGAIIHKVFSRTPAENGGLRENDIIMEIGRQNVRSAEDARRLIDLAPVGKEMPVTVLRGQRRVVLTVRPVDLAVRLRQMRRERQQQIQQDRQRFQELGPFQSMLQ